MWGYIELKACATSHPNVESLKEAICREWEAMPIDFVKNSFLSFERCLKAVIEAGGCHVEDKRLDLTDDLRVRQAFSAVKF